MEVITIESQAFKEIQDDLKEIKGDLEKLKYQSIEDIWLPSKRIIKILGICPKTWQTYRDNKLIRFSQIGQKIYVRVTWLEEFMEKYKVQENN